MFKLHIESSQEIESITINFKDGKVSSTTTRPDDAKLNTGVSSPPSSYDPDWEEPMELRPSDDPVSFSETARASDNIDVDLNDLMAQPQHKELPSITLPDITNRETPDGAVGMSDEEL